MIAMLLRHADQPIVLLKMMRAEVLGAVLAEVMGGPLRRADVRVGRPLPHMPIAGASARDLCPLPRHACE